MSNATVEELVEVAKKPGKFKIVDAIKNRGYPTDEVAVYLDERAAYAASNVSEQIEELNKVLDKNPKDKDATAALSAAEAKLTELKQALADSKYVFVISGIDEGDREDLLKLAEDAFPIETKEKGNAFSGEVTMEEKESPERDMYFTNLLWKAHITEAIAPDLSTDSDLSLEDIKEIRRALPISATSAITQAIEKIRISTAVFMFTVDEDFLAKS